MARKLTYEELEQKLEACSAELKNIKHTIAQEPKDHSPMAASLQKNHNSLDSDVDEGTQALQEENKQLKIQLEERIMMTEVLHENEQQFRALVANIPGAVYRFCIDSEWTIEFISDVIEEITSYPASHFKWRPTQVYRDIIHAEDRESVTKGILEGIKPMTSMSIEYRITDANGQIHWLVENGQAVFNSKGDPLWFDGIIFDVTERKKAEAELAAVQKEFIKKAHQAGMADIATDTLHNVGNILNSVKTSTHILSNILHDSSLSGMKKANNMLRENMDGIEAFISVDPKGKKLLQYYLMLEDEFVKEYNDFQEHLERIGDKVNDIEDVIIAQQNYAGANSLIESLDLSEIVEDVLIIQSSTIKDFSIGIEKHFLSVPKVDAQKDKVVYILVNLIQNAKDAMAETPSENRKLTFTMESHDNAVFLKVQDTGFGVTSENIKKIFSHGFTTKEFGKGFGLHSSANYMNEMKGRMWAESDGNKNGATFILQFPSSQSSG